STAAPPGRHPDCRLCRVPDVPASQRESSRLFLFVSLGAGPLRVARGVGLRVLAGGLLAATLLLRGGGCRLRLLTGLGQCRVEHVLLGPLLLRILQCALRTGKALVLLPVSGHLEQGEHGLGRLGAHIEPILRPLGLHLDQTRVLLRVVLTDRFDGPTATPGPRIGDDHPVEGLADLAQTLQFDLDSHGYGSSWISSVLGSGRMSTVWGVRLPAARKSCSLVCTGPVRGSSRRRRLIILPAAPRRTYTPGKTQACRTPRLVSRIATAGKKLFTWCATILASNLPVLSRASPIGMAMTSNSAVRIGSRWLAANTAVETRNAARRPHRAF